MDHHPRASKIPEPADAWGSGIPEEQWSIYREVIVEAKRREVPFALGGAFATATHTNHWKDSKDLDIYVLPENRQEMIAVLNDLGLRDYYEKAPYDRGWIYRGYTANSIVDIIWGMANHRSLVDEEWLTRGPEINVRGEMVKVLASEEMLWDKLFIMQRDRCDWPDVLSLIHTVGPSMDWHYVLRRLDEDWLLLAAALTVFKWMAPGRARDLPPWLWHRLELSPPEPSALGTNPRNVRLLDSRPWLRIG